MKKFLLPIIFLLPFSNVSATEASKFLENKYQKICEYQKVHITVKKEHTQEYTQIMGNQIIPAITYGYGDFKAKGCKKHRISYICTLDKNCNIIWGQIIFY